MRLTRWLLGCVTFTCASMMVTSSIYAQNTQRLERNLDVLESRMFTDPKKQNLEKGLHQFKQFQDQVNKGIVIRVGPPCVPKGYRARFGHKPCPAEDEGKFIVHVQAPPFRYAYNGVLTPLPGMPMAQQRQWSTYMRQLQSFGRAADQFNRFPRPYTAASPQERAYRNLYYAMWRFQLQRAQLKGPNIPASITQTRTKLLSMLKHIETMDKQRVRSAQQMHALRQNLSQFLNTTDKYLSLMVPLMYRQWYSNAIEHQKKRILERIQAFQKTAPAQIKTAVQKERAMLRKVYQRDLNSLRRLKNQVSQLPSSHELARRYKRLEYHTQNQIKLLEQTSQVGAKQIKQRAQRDVEQQLKALSGKLQPEGLYGYVPEALRQCVKKHSSLAQVQRHCQSLASKMNPQTKSYLTQAICLEKATTSSARLQCLSGQVEAKCLKAMESGQTTQALACVNKLPMTPQQKQALRVASCATAHQGDLNKTSACVIVPMLGKKERAFVQCMMQKNQTGSWVGQAAGCALPGMNDESKIMLECATKTGGNPKAFAVCSASRLTERELNKCMERGIGDDGCFGQNNTMRKMFNGVDQTMRTALGKNNDFYKAYKLYHDNVLSPGQGHEAVKLFNRGIFETRMLNQTIINLVTQPDRVAADTEKLFKNMGREINKGFEDTNSNVGRELTQFKKNIDRELTVAKRNIDRELTKAKQDIDRGLTNLRQIADGTQRVQIVYIKVPKPKIKLPKIRTPRVVIKAPKIKISKPKVKISCCKF